MKRKAYEIWAYNMSDGSSKHFYHQTLQKHKAEEWCSKQYGIMGTRPPNDHHWVVEVEISQKQYDKLVAREMLLVKLIPILTDEEFETLGIDYRF